MSDDSKRPVPHPAILQQLAHKLGVGGRTMAQASRQFCRQAFKGEPQLAEKEIAILLQGASEIARTAGRMQYFVELAVRLSGGLIESQAGAPVDQPEPSANVVSLAPPATRPSNSNVRWCGRDPDNIIECPSPTVCGHPPHIGCQHLTENKNHG